MGDQLQNWEANGPAARDLERLLLPEAGQELVLLCGIPGSGKSTLYQRYFARTHAHISLDLLRRRRRERETLEAQLAAGRSALVDNTNVLRQERLVYLELARAYKLPTRCIYLETPLKLALLRNAAREGKARIPDVGVITKHQLLERPALDEGYAALLTLSLDEAWRLRLVSYMAV